MTWQLLAACVKSAMANGQSLSVLFVQELSSLNTLNSRLLTVSFEANSDICHFAARSVTRT